MQSGCYGSEFTAVTRDGKDMQSADMWSDFLTCSSGLAFPYAQQSRLLVVRISFQLRNEFPLRSKWEQRFSQPSVSSK